MTHEARLALHPPRPWLKDTYYAVLGALSLIGIVALVVRLVGGLKVTALTSPVAWGMWVAVYIYFIGLSAGSFLLSTLIYVFGMQRYEKVGRMALLSALFALFAGLLFVWIDLGHPERLWQIFARWNYTSVLAWEVLAYLFYIAVICCELWLLMRCDLAALLQQTNSRLYGVLTLGFHCPSDRAQYEACHLRSLRVVKVLGIVGIPVAIVVHGGTGAIFAVVTARPYWFTGLFPIIFLVSALASGAALMTFLYAFCGRRDEDHLDITRGMARLMVLFLTLDVLLLASEYLVGLYGRIPEHAAVYQQILFGPFPYTFWGGQVLLGIVVPLLLASLPRTRGHTTWLGLAGLSAVVGIVAVRLNLVIPAFVVPVLHGLDAAYRDPRATYFYFPSFWEWASTVGLIALLVLVFSRAFQRLPMFHEFAERFPAEEQEGSR
jgi:molybdopterin-containing oxidoreductase family membrane subunit